MSTVNVKSTLLNPANQVSPNTPIRLTSVLGYGDTLTSSTTVVTTDATGNYDFDLVYGTHMIEVRFEDKYVKLGTCVVGSDVGPLTINELLLSNTPLVPEYITTILQSLTEAREAADRAEEYAREALETGAMIEAGSVDLSGGVYPEPLKDLDGNNRACFWKVIVGGTVSGVVYGTGDSLVYSAETDSYYKIDNTESVTSVNGKQGVVVLSAGDVSALPESRGADIDSNTDTIATKIPATATAILAGLNWDGVDYVDPDAIGANATAKIYPDGSIVGSTDNVSYTKWPNGDLTAEAQIPVGAYQSNTVYSTPTTGLATTIFTLPLTVVSVRSVSTIMLAGSTGLAPYFQRAFVRSISNTQINHQSWWAISIPVNSNVVFTVKGRWK